jgi:hypothetical protein
MRQIYLILIFILLSFSGVFGQDCDALCGSDLTLTASSDNPPEVCGQWFYNGVPTGVFGCTFTITDMCINDSGVYSVEVTDDCGNVETVNITASAVGPTVIIVENSSTCSLTGFIVNCQNPTYEWIDPDGGTFTGTLTFAVPPTQCGLWTLNVLDCDGCTDCAESDTHLFDPVACCSPPDCFAGMFIVQNDCELTAVVTNCDEVPPSGLTPTYLWSTGATTPSINVTTNGLYSVTVTGCCDDPMVDTHNVTDCEPPPPCDCSVTAIADDANCEIDIIVTGANCANYTMGVLNYGSADGSCSQGNCTVASGLPAVSTSVAGANCSGSSDIDGDYKVVLFPNAGSGCSFKETCVTLDCNDCEVTENIDATGSISWICNGSGNVEGTVDPATSTGFDVPDCCGYAAFSQIGTYDINITVKINGSVFSTSSQSDQPIFLFAPNFAEMPPNTGPSYLEFGCAAVNAGDLVEAVVVYSNIDIVGCEYNGPTVFTTTFSGTVPAAEYAACCGCSAPNIVMPTAPPVGQALLSSGATVTFCSAPNLDWSIGGGINEDDIFILHNNTTCSDADLAIAAAGGAAILVTFQQMLDDIEAEINLISGCSGVNLFYNSGTNEVEITGQVDCMDAFSILMTDISASQIGVNCVVSSNNGAINYQSQTDCCP